MNIAIIILLAVGVFTKGSLTLSLWGDEYTFTINWLVLVALILFLVKFGI